MGLINIPKRQRVFQPIGMPQVDWDDPLNRGIVGFWPMAPYEFGGKVVHDLSGNGNTGTRNGTGTIWTPGKFGSAQQFNGSDDSVSVGAAIGVPNGNNERTIAFWFNADTFDTGFEDPFIAFAVDGGAGTMFHIAAEENAISVAFSSHRLITPKGVLSTGVWYFTTIIVPLGATSTADVDISINGINQILSTEAGSSQILNTGAVNLMIGRDSHSAGYFYSGQIGLVSIYNRALSASEIALLYQRMRAI